MNTIECGIKHKKWDYIDFCNFILNRLGVDGISLKIFEDTKMCDRFSSDDLELGAILVTYLPSQYILHIRRDECCLHVLAHELVHLHQYYRGDLVASDSFRKFLWKGVTFDNSVDYFKREWEREAFMKQNQLVRSYKKHLRKIKNNK